MSFPNLVVRCDHCGAPLLNPTVESGTCRYCGADNRLDFTGNAVQQEAARQMEAMRRTAADADRWVPEIQRRTDELQRALAGEREKLLLAPHRGRDTPARRRRDPERGAAVPGRSFPIASPVEERGGS